MHDFADYVVTLLHHRVQIGLLTVAKRADDGGVDVKIVLVVLLYVLLDGVSAREAVNVLIEVVVELRHTVNLMQHAIG